MSDRATVMIVDDVEIIRMMLESALSETYQIISVNSGEECLAACAKERPDIVLLDVEMPEMSGYETCRKIKSADENAPPVIFISGHDRLQDRLEGYDAGGDDYILKPVEPRELLTKIALRLKDVEDQKQLKMMADYAGSTAMTAMSSMGEMGVLLQALQRFNNCSTLTQLGQEVLKALADYSLEGLVSLNAPDDVVMLSSHGTITPMEISVIGHVAAMGRIVEYRSRMAISYDHVSLLVSNAPNEEDDRRGRLRDHLAVLAESAELRTLAIHRDHVIERAVSKAGLTLDHIDESQRQVQVASSLALHDMSTQLERAFMSSALSQNQEDQMRNIVETGIDKVRQSLLSETDVQQQLTAVINELRSVTRQNSAATTPPKNDV